MGVNLEMYRARIGQLTDIRYHVMSSVFNSILVTSIVLFIMTLVMYLILLCDDVELILTLDRNQHVYLCGTALSEALTLRNDSP